MGEKVASCDGSSDSIPSPLLEAELALEFACWQPEQGLPGIVVAEGLKDVAPGSFDPLAHSE